MGIADLPRVTFQGWTYWNPSTMNNNDYQPTYEPSTATLSWAYLERHGLSDVSGFDDYVTRPNVPSTANDGDEGYVASVPPAEWNFYGGNGCGFVQPGFPGIEWPGTFALPTGPSTTVTGYSLQAGQPVTSGDPWIGLPVQLLANGTDVGGAAVEPKLVDVDPVAPWSSQIFADRFSVGDATTGGLEATLQGRAHSRWTNFARNYNVDGSMWIAGIASAMWQFAFEWSDITLLPGSSSSGIEKALARLRSTGKDRGLMVRFVTYATQYFTGEAFLNKSIDQCFDTVSAIYQTYRNQLAEFERGEREQAPRLPVNRAYSRTVGWLAPWTSSDMRSAPTGRLLYGSSATVPQGVTPNGHGPWFLGPVAVEVVPDAANAGKVARLAIDLGSTIPEVDSSLAKADLDDLELGLTQPDGTVVAVVTLAPSDYGRTAYEAGAGIIDVPGSKLTSLTMSAFKAPLVLRRLPGDGTCPTVMTESELTAETDDRGVYLDESGGPATITVEVRWHGAAPPAGTQLQIAQYSPSPVQFNESNWVLVSTADAEPDSLAPQSPLVTMRTGSDAPPSSANGAYYTVVVPGAAKGSDHAEVVVEVGAIRPGAAVLRVHPALPSPPIQAPLPTLAFPVLINQYFANVRVLPFHDAAAASYEAWLTSGPSVDIATQRAVDAVFRTYLTMYPRMRFLEDPVRFQAWRGRVLDVTDPAGFESARYMPVTRSMSAGQRRILELWASYVDGDLATTNTPEEPRGRRG